MTRLTRASLALLSISAAWAQLPAPASQVQDLPYQVRYISNLNLGDSSVNITNSGAQGAGLQSGTAATLTGALCANVYTFSPDEQLISCCSCPVTPNGLVSLSARLDLINNTLTPAVPTSIVVKVLASVPVIPAGGTAVSCANSAANPAGVGGGALLAATAPVGLVAWATTVHRGPTAGTVNTGPLQLTETQFSPSFLSDAANSTTAVATGSANVGEVARLTRLCTFIQANGSGFGICNSCRLGGLGAGRL